MKSNHDKNGHEQDWPALAERLGRGLGRGPLTLDDARTEFATAPTASLALNEIETIILAGGCLDQPVAPQSNGAAHLARRSGGRGPASHALRHEPLDRRDLPAPLTLLFCTADVAPASPEPPEQIEVPSGVDTSAWISDLHTVDRAPWHVPDSWSTVGELAVGGAYDEPPLWQDTLEVDATLALAGVSSRAAEMALAATTTDVTHDAVFGDDGWRDAAN